MKNNNNDDFDLSRYYNFDPYDWMTEIDANNKTLLEKYTIVCRNQRELAFALNTQLKHINDLKKRIDTLEEIIWRNSPDDETAIAEYIKCLRPERKPHGKVPR